MGKIEKGHQKKQLSWIYRTKKRTNKIKKKDDHEAFQKKGRIIVRNLPFTVTEKDLQNLYRPFGEIEEINLPRRPDGKLVGCGFVQFKEVTDASKAIFNTNKKDFLGRVITSTWALSKSKYVDKMNKLNENVNDEKDEEEGKEDDKEEDGNQNNDTIDIEPDTSNKKVKRKEIDPESKKQQRKMNKLKKRKKKARIVVRNLSFEATEDILKECFSEYGEIEEVRILRNAEGKPIGCGFVQFERVQSAAKAIHHTNMTPLLERPMVVDWAIPKNQFSEKIKTEKDDSAIEDSKEIKVEPIDVEEEATSRDDDVTVLKNEIKDEVESNYDNEHEEDDDDDDEYDEHDGYTNKDDSSDDEKKFIKLESPEDVNQKRPRVISNDVNEGRTVFLKNVPFSVNNEELKQFIEGSFGPVFYALVCMDPLTEHSKGTAFVKFRNIEDTEKCLSAGTELRLHDQIIEVCKALHKNEIQDKKSSNDQKIKDSRNLYLVKEGVILAGSPAAVGVSASDMAKRLQLEQWKSQILRNLNMFVSRVRLVISNLPSTLDDNKLRQIVKKYSPQKAIIREARIMRDFKNIDASGLGKSKEYGFVTFTSHEDALIALRNINNNPNIFTPHKRPIVSFSIENRIMINAKQNRIQKSRERNPIWSGDKTKAKNSNSSSNNEERVVKRIRHEEVNEVNRKPYAGTVGKPGQNKLRSRFNLKTQALLHKENLKNEKKKLKVIKKFKEQKREARASNKEIKTKQQKKHSDMDEVNFSKLVNKYKQKITAFENEKSKWYES